MRESALRLGAVICPSVVRSPRIACVASSSAEQQFVVWTGAVKASLAWEPKVAGLVNLWCAPYPLNTSSPALRCKGFLNNG